MHSGSAPAKLPAVTLGFWIIKILATTMGEIGGDTVSMSMGVGYLASTGLFFVAFVAAVALQISLRRFTAPVYWLAVIASTTVGTTLADFADRSLDIGYPGGTALLLALTLGSLFAWRRTLGSIDIATVVDARSEMWYWVTIMFSQTLGTALGDWTADSIGLGYTGAALLFSGLLTLVVVAFAFTRISPHGAVLDSVRAHPAARRSRGRLSRQAAGGRRSRTEPLLRDPGVVGGHCNAGLVRAAARFTWRAERQRTLAKRSA
jgi:uncharacterized membrane-anchored protein